MFTLTPASDTRRQRLIRATSLGLHALVLALLLHGPKAIRLSPNSVALGENGTSLTRLYWPSKTPDNSKASSSDLATQRYRHERLGHKLAWKKQSEPAKLTAPQTPISRLEKQDNSDTQTLSSAGHGAQAGARYGTLASNAFSGDEVRPAFPTATADPDVYPWQYPTSPGNEVIEITIDERGEVVNKTVLQSLGSEIDTKCLAALDNWHFHPATRNGTPIPSKQDAIFPFRARG